jgi:hypothetical protein
VGYVNKTFAPGFTMFANPLVAEDNDISALIPEAPVGTTAYAWNEGELKFDIVTSFGAAGWSGPLEFLPGGGGFIGASAEFTVTFVGEVMQSVPPYVAAAGDPLQNPIPEGLSIRSSMVPQAGALADLGLDNLPFQSTVYTWDVADQKYAINTLLVPPDTWSLGAAPSLEVAEAMFVAIPEGQALTWERVFSVN